MKPAALLLALVPTFAQAQSQGCTELSEIQKAWQEQNINTLLVFRGQGDNGTLTYIFENPDNGRWSEWMASPQAPSCVKLYDQGGGASTQQIEFTKQAPPEQAL